MKAKMIEKGKLSSPFVISVGKSYDIYSVMKSCDGGMWVEVLDENDLGVLFKIPSSDMHDSYRQTIIDSWGSWELER